MISIVFLTVTAIVVLVLCFRLLRQTQGTSLLAWHILAFVTVYNTTAFFIAEIIENTLPLATVYYDPVVANRVILSLVLTNLVFGGLLIVAKRTVVSTGESSIVTKLRGFPTVFWLGFGLVAIGLASLMATPAGSLVLEMGRDTLGDYNEYYGLRYETSLIGASLIDQYIFLVGLATFLPLMTLYGLQRYVLQREKMWLLIWLALVVVWTFTSFIQFGKANVVNVALSNVVVLVLSLRSRSNRIPILWSAIGIVFVFWLVGFIYQFLGAVDSFGEATRLLLERYITVPMVGAYRHFLVFPDIFPFLHWSNSRTLNLILGFGQWTNTGGELSYQIASGILTGRAFNMNTGFLGAGWAEFGYLGVVQSALLIFGVLLCWDIFFGRSRVKIPMAALLAFFLGRIWNIHNVDLMFMLLQGGVILAPIVYVLFFFKELKAFQRLPAANAEKSLPA